MTKQYFIPASLWPQVEEVEAAAGEAVSPSTADEWYAIAGEATAATLTTAAPSYTVTLGAIIDGQSVGAPGSGADVEAVLGGADGSPPGDYTWSATADGSPVALPHTASAGEAIVLTISDAGHPLGAFSSDSNEVTVGAALATLSNPTVTENAGDIDVGVESDTAGGTIYFGARLSTSPQLSASDIINTTGDCLATVTDGTPTADANNAATFINPSDGTYVVDVVQVTASGNSNIVSTGTVVVDKTAPVLQTAATAGANTIELAYDETLAGGVTLSEVTVTIDGTPENPTNDAVAGNTLTLTIATTLVGGETITIDYTRSTSTLADAKGNFAADLTAQAVTNNVGSSEVITALFVADQDTDGVVDLTYTISGDSNVNGVVTTSATTPSAAQVNAGEDHLGNPASSSFTNDLWTVSGSDTLPDITAGLAPNTYYLHVLPAGGGDGEVFTSNGFALDTAAPALDGNPFTDSAGTVITVPYDEALAGSVAGGEYSISGAASSPTVTGASISGSNVLLTLSAAIANGETITLTFTGTSLTDATATPAATFSGQAVTNNVPGAFVEPTVVVGGDYLDTQNPLPSDLQSILVFASVQPAAGVTGRAAGMTGSNYPGILYLSDAAGLGAGSNLPGSISGGNAVNFWSISPEERYDVLIAARIADDGSRETLLWVWRNVDGWLQRAIDTTSSGAGSKLVVGTNPLRFFNRTAGGHQWNGNVHAMEIYGATSGAAHIADITDGAVRDLFSTGGAVQSPSARHAAIGQPLVGLTGDTAAYNNGLHTGSLPALTVTGAFA